MFADEEANCYRVFNLCPGGLLNTTLYAFLVGLHWISWLDI